MKKRATHIVDDSFSLVEVTGLEPAASWSQTKHSTKLSYTSKTKGYYTLFFHSCQVDFFGFFCYNLLLKKVL